MLASGPDSSGPTWVDRVVPLCKACVGFPWPFGVRSECPLLPGVLGPRAGRALSLPTSPAGLPPSEQVLCRPCQAPCRGPAGLS